MRGLLLGYSFEPRPNNRTPGYDFRFITERMLALENSLSSLQTHYFLLSFGLFLFPYSQQSAKKFATSKTELWTRQTILSR